jgi:hypothetical protein
MTVLFTKQTVYRKFCSINGLAILCGNMAEYMKRRESRIRRMGHRRPMIKTIGSKLLISGADTDVQEF